MYRVGGVARCHGGHVHLKGLSADLQTDDRDQLQQDNKQEGYQIGMRPGQIQQICGPGLYLRSAQSDLLRSAADKLFADPVYIARADRKDDVSRRGDRAQRFFQLRVVGEKLSVGYFSGQIRG